jgi:hypothetical protein
MVAMARGFASFHPAATTGRQVEVFLDHLQVVSISRIIGEEIEVSKCLA